MALSLLNFAVMGWICQHCGAPFFDSAYRVKSEESGVVLLDMIVCEHCDVEARDLGLHTEKSVFGLALAPEATVALPLGGHAKPAYQPIPCIAPARATQPLLYSQNFAPRFS